MRGFIVGEPDDLMSLAGTAAGDLFVYGDARDAVREGVRLARGEEADELILGLACVGLAVTAGTYASLGVGAPARVGLSVFKAARRTGRIGAELSGAVVRAVKESVDAAALKQAPSRAPPCCGRRSRCARRARPSRSKRPAACCISRATSGACSRSAGTRAALDGLKLADNPRTWRASHGSPKAKGLKTRAIMKLLGRGAIMLTRGDVQSRQLGVLGDRQPGLVRASRSSARPNARRCA